MYWILSKTPVWKDSQLQGGRETEGTCEGKKLGFFPLCFFFYFYSCYNMYLQPIHPLLSVLLGRDKEVWYFGGLPTQSMGGHDQAEPSCAYSRQTSPCRDLLTPGIRAYDGPGPCPCSARFLRAWEDTRTTPQLLRRSPDPKQRQDSLFSLLSLLGTRSSLSLYISSINFAFASWWVAFDFHSGWSQGLLRNH